MVTGTKRMGRPLIREITPAQQRVLDLFRQYRQQHGIPPTSRELSSLAGHSSQNIHQLLQQLVKKGYLNQESRKARGLTLAKEPEQPRSALVPVSIVGTVAAGIPLLAEENLVGEVLVEEQVVRGSECFALKVKGNSMTNAGIRDGDLIIVHRQPAVENGEIVVALVDGEATVKRFSVQDRSVQLCPENGRFKPIPITADTDFQIVGKVIAHRRCR